MTDRDLLIAEILIEGIRAESARLRRERDEARAERDKLSVDRDKYGETLEQIRDMDFVIDATPIHHKMRQLARGALGGGDD